VGGGGGGGGLDTLYSIAFALGTAYVGWELTRGGKEDVSDEDACPNCGCVSIAACLCW
jgi:hypothetical protein